MTTSIHNGTPVKVHYGFQGFRSPVSAGVTTATASRALPFKWALTDPAGRAVTAISAVKSYQFDASGATYSLKVDGGEYVVLANAPTSWAGTRRTFTLTLDDDSVHTAVVQF